MPAAPIWRVTANGSCLLSNRSAASTTRLSVPQPRDASARVAFFAAGSSEGIIVVRSKHSGGDLDLPVSPGDPGSNGTLSCTGGLAVGTSAAMVEPPGSRELLLYLPI